MGSASRQAGKTVHAGNLTGKQAPFKTQPPGETGNNFTDCLRIFVISAPTLVICAPKRRLQARSAFPFPLSFPAMKPILLRLAFVASAIATAAAPQWARADDTKDFVTQHLSDVIKTDLVQIHDPAVLPTFSAPIFTVTLTISDMDGTQTNNLVVARSGDKVVPVSRPSGDGDYPQIQKLFNPGLKLTNDDAAATVQKALDLVYPIVGSNDQPAKAFSHNGNQWTFVRGFFMEGKKLGFLLTTDGDGAVTSVKFSLEIP